MLRKIHANPKFLIESGKPEIVPADYSHEKPVSLNNVSESYSYSENKESMMRFTAPEANVIVVDDINTNLIVIEGLLSPYAMQVKLCNSGMESIEALSAKQYDLVFMDHMMPEMDGIEATARIRALAREKPYCKSIPIVALTANAVSGTKEMFLKNGFDDFLSKPVDTVKLNAILKKWIPGEKQKQHAVIDNSARAVTECGNGFMEIEGLDVNKGIALIGGKTEVYQRILDLYCKNSEERLPFFQTAPDAGTLNMFVTQVHALKGASASIGASEVSVLATELEAAGKAGDTALIEKKLPFFTERLLKLVGEIRSRKTTGGKLIPPEAEKTASGA